MKTIRILLITIVMFGFLACEKAEETVLTEKVVLQPNSEEGIDASISSIEYNENFGNDADASLLALSEDIGFSVTRYMIKFDLSSIPENAIITKATLSMYFHEDTKVNQKHTGDNYFIIRRVTSAWSEESVTWYNQPIVTSTNQISVTKSAVENQDFTNINITNLVKDIIFYKEDKNFGIQLRLQSETPDKATVLASSDHSDGSKRPKLEVEYVLK